MAVPFNRMPKLKLDNKKKSLQYVVAVDDSNCARNAFAWADFVANTKDKITILHSYDTDNQLAVVNDRYGKYPKANSQRYAVEILNDEYYDMDQRIKHFVNAGQKQSVDILVTGYHGKTYEDGVKKSHFGSTSDLSLRSARCSSFFVRDLQVPENQGELKIAVGVDGSQNSVHAFEFAKQILAPNNTLYVVHIQTEYSNNKQIPEQYKSQNVIKNYTKYIEEAQKELAFDVSMEIKLLEGVIKISDGLC
eukprot:UN00957